MPADPAWYPRAAALLAGGGTIKATAEQLEIGEKTVRRHLKAPAGTLARMVEAARAERAQGGASLREQALDLIARQVAQGDVGAAKVALQHVEPPAAPREEVEEEVTFEDAVEEVVAALPTLGDLLRLGRITRETFERAREAARALLADDGQPRPPVDLEAERVDAVVPAPGEPSGRRPAAEGAAQVIPIR